MPTTFTRPHEGYDELEIHKLMVLSTAHITQEDDALLMEQDKSAEEIGVYADAIDHGYLITLGIVNVGVTDNVRTQSLIPIVTKAVAMGAKYIRLDPDGPIIEGLQRYNW